MAEMRPTVFADNFRPMHAVAVVGAEFDVLAVGGFGKARPARSRFKFRIGRKQFRAAVRAFVHAPRVLVHILPAERRLGPALAHDVDLLLGQVFVLFFHVSIISIRGHRGWSTAPLIKSGTRSQDRSQTPQLSPAPLILLFFQ